MVILFESNVVSPPAKLYMGVDKVENEELIKWGWPEDVWFHVDKLSSAHVYLRLPPGSSLTDVPSQLIDDCAQLVKANSIQGNKMNNIGVVYTMWENLKKTGDMAVGQVGFHKQKEVHSVHVEKRINEIINRLNKTKREETIDYRGEREERDRLEREDKKAKMRAERKAKEDEERKKAQEAELKSYDRLFDATKMSTNKDKDYDSDEFM